MKPIRRERDADSGNSIVYSSFHLHETGLTPIGAPSFEEWLECGRFIRHAEQSVHFWIGDWLAYGEAHFKEDYEEAIASPATPITPFDAISTWLSASRLSDA